MTAYYVALVYGDVRRIEAESPATAARLAFDNVVEAGPGRRFVLLPHDPGSSTVEASGSSTVRASDSSTVEASGSVAIHKYPGGRQKITGGVVILVPDLVEINAKGWCAYYGVKVERGQAMLFKCVDDDFATGRSRVAGIFYTAGAKIEAPDWKPTKKCGSGLHVSPRPWMARHYNEKGTRYVAVRCRLADLVAGGELGDKVKVPRLTVIGEVDVDGEAVASSGEDSQAHKGKVS